MGSRQHEAGADDEAATERVSVQNHRHLIGVPGHSAGSASDDLPAELRAGSLYTQLLNLLWTRWGQLLLID